MNSSLIPSSNYKLLVHEVLNLGEVVEGVNNFKRLVFSEYSQEGRSLWGDMCISFS